MTRQPTQPGDMISREKVVEWLRAEALGAELKRNPLYWKFAKFLRSYADDIESGKAP